MEQGAVLGIVWIYYDVSGNETTTLSGTGKAYCKIPYWDFDDPKVPDALRDASAAAIMASALLELSGYVDKVTGQGYIAVAETQLRTLASDEYLAKPGENCNFILKHSVGFLPQNSEVDVPLTYADYYFVEALMRYRAMHLKE